MNEQIDPRAANAAKARAARAAKAAAARTTNPHEVGTPHAGLEQVVYGRNGEVLSRKRSQVGDMFDFPRDQIDPGWDYQWCAASVLGNTDVLIEQNQVFHDAGWRPVPATRHPSWGSQRTGNNIVRGGMILMERPMALTEEARAEDIKLAKQLISDRNEALKLSGMKKGMADGFEMGGRYRGTGGDIRMSIDPALDIPRPSTKLAEPGE